jgi:hypothetical protein
MCSSITAIPKSVHQGEVMEKSAIIGFFPLHSTRLTSGVSKPCAMTKRLVGIRVQLIFFNKE